LSSVVIDASIAGALLLEEERSPTVMAAQEAIRLGNGIVPVLFEYEVTNLVKTCSAKWTAKQMSKVFANLDKWPLVVDRSTPKLHTLCKLAIDCKLSVYDAVYLELAKRQDLPLATLDKALQRAATHVGVQLFE